MFIYFRVRGNVMVNRVQYLPHGSSLRRGVNCRGYELHYVWSAVGHSSTLVAHSIA